MLHGTQVEGYADPAFEIIMFEWAFGLWGLMYWEPLGIGKLLDL